MLNAVGEAAANAAASSAAAAVTERLLGRNDANYHVKLIGNEVDEEFFRSCLQFLQSVLEHVATKGTDRGRFFEADYTDKKICFGVCCCNKRKQVKIDNSLVVRTDVFTSLTESFVARRPGMLQRRKYVGVRAVVYFIRQMFAACSIVNTAVHHDSLAPILRRFFNTIRDYIDAKFSALSCCNLKGIKLLNDINSLYQSLRFFYLRQYDGVICNPDNPRVYFSLLTSQLIKLLFDCARKKEDITEFSVYDPASRAEFYEHLKKVFPKDAFFIKGLSFMPWPCAISIRGSERNRKNSSGASLTLFLPELLYLKNFVDQYDEEVSSKPMGSKPMGSKVNLVSLKIIAACILQSQMLEILYEVAREPPNITSAVDLQFCSRLLGGIQTMLVRAKREEPVVFSEGERALSVRYKLSGERVRTEGVARALANCKRLLPVAQCNTLGLKGAEELPRQYLCRNDSCFETPDITTEHLNNLMTWVTRFLLSIQNYSYHKSCSVAPLVSAIKDGSLVAIVIIFSYLKSNDKLSDCFASGDNAAVVGGQDQEVSSHGSSRSNSFSSHSSLDGGSGLLTQGLALGPGNKQRDSNLRGARNSYDELKDLTTSDSSKQYKEQAEDGRCCARCTSRLCCGSTREKRNQGQSIFFHPRGVYDHLIAKVRKDLARHSTRHVVLNDSSFFFSDSETLRDVLVRNNLDIQFGSLFANKDFMPQLVCYLAVFKMRLKQVVYCMIRDNPSTREILIGCGVLTERGVAVDAFRS